MRTYFLLLFFTTIVLKTQTQKTDSLPVRGNEKEAVVLHDTIDEVFIFCSQMPALKDKHYKIFNDYAQTHMTYPADAQKAHVTGAVYVHFIIETDGSLSDVHIVKGRNLYPSCDKTALDVVSKSEWNPGLQNEKPVQVRMIVKIMFDRK